MLLRHPQRGAGGREAFFFFFFITLGLELNDTQVYGVRPQAQAAAGAGRGTCWESGELGSLGAEYDTGVPRPYEKRPRP